MELQFPSLPVAVTLFLFLFMLVKKSKEPRKQKLPPGPWKLPIIGHLHHFVGQPHRCLRELAMKHGSLMHLQLCQLSTVIVSSPKVAKEMLKTHDSIFVDRSATFAVKIMTYDSQDMVFAPYGEYWRQLRKICVLELLSAKRVQSFSSLREEEVSNLIQSISAMAGSPVNISKSFFSLTNDVVARAAFGKKCKDKEVFLSAIREAIAYDGFNIADLFPSLKFINVINGTKRELTRIHLKIDKVVDEIIKEHRENRKATSHDNNNNEVEDLVDVFIRLQEDGNLEFPITTDNVKAVIFDIFSAGSDTSSTSLEWAMSELVRDPRVMEKAQAEVRQVFNGKTKIDQTDMNELHYLKLVIKESLRLHPPIPLLPARFCKERCEIDGYVIPKETKVIVNTWAVARDPAYWSDPEKFVPERFQDTSVDYKGNSFEYIPFGAGRRMCPGILFGIANVEFPLAQLLYHFDWKLPNGMKPEELDMTEKSGITVKRRNDLYLIPVPYTPLVE